jgi:glyoxylase-like metal-dependent hydrolase (beta-lactamase superfamily II)
MKHAYGLSGILLPVLFHFSGAVALAQGQPPAAFTAHQLTPNVYWVEGGGGNSGVIVGDNGVIVVDAKTTEAGGKQLLAEIAKITPKPVNTVILTHSDGDHVNGLAAFPTEGVKVIAHENNKKEQETAQAAGGRGAPPAGHLPTQVVTKEHETLKIDGVTLEAYHWAPAHTSGDLIVYLPAEKIVFTGDIIATQMPDPLIHLEKHGSSEGWITTVKGIVALNADRFVPGHGDVQSKAAVEQRLKAASEKREKIKELVGQGKSLDEIKAAVDPAPAPAANAGRGGRGPGFASYTDVVYRELTGKN